MQNVCPNCRAEYGLELDVCPEDGARLVRAAADPLVGQVLADRYRVLRTIGEGGMGRVYLAEHVKMGRKSAVKVMSPAHAPTPEAISRFNREAANASQIHQPNVAAIYDFGETADGTLYLAMEYVEGETLSALLRREGPLAPRRAAELTGQIADGLQAAHHLGIVHRDLKPDNILVTRQPDGREWVKIVDFGIAKTTKDVQQNVTSIGMAIGTPEYMSPEQLAGEELDARTDVYSLGLVLFNMLTGVLPHAKMTSKHSLVERLTAKPKTLAEVRPNVAWPPRLQRALDRALSPELDDRYRTVGDLARDVRSAAGSPLFAGAAAAAGVLTTMMTPLTVPSVPTPQPAASRPRAKSGGKGMVFVVLLVLIGTGALVAMRPPRVLDELLRANGVQLGMAKPPKPPAPAHPVDSASSSLAQQGVALPHATADSATAAGTSRGDSLSPLDPGQRLRSAALRAAGGDSSGNVPVVMQSAETDAREIVKHINAARDLTRKVQLKAAGLELRDSYEMYRIYLTEHASAPQLESLKKELQSVMDEALNTCYAARDSAAAHGAHPFRCEYPAKTGILVADDDDPAPRTP